MTNNRPLLPTRIEGRNIDYFAALVNADGLDGFTISGKGTINGNGLRYWKSFWLRRKFNPQCTNLDEMRPRLIFISNSRNVHLTGVRLINSPFWTTHLYKSENVRLSNLYIFAPREPVKAPSSDAVWTLTYVPMCISPIAISRSTMTPSHLREARGLMPIKTQTTDPTAM